MKIIIMIFMFLGAYAEDFLVLGGLTLIVKATFMLNIVAGIYTLGFICLGFGLILARKPPRKE